MLFSNLSLEISLNKRGERVLELSTLYNNCISLQVDRNLNSKIQFVKNCFHKHLTLKEFADQKYRLVNEEDDDIYIILDTLDYKIFNQSSKINFISDNFEILRNFHMCNRSHKFYWDLRILKVKDPKKDGISILEYVTTSGEKKYIVIDQGKLKHLNRYTFMILYSAEYMKQLEEKKKLIAQCV